MMEKVFERIEANSIEQYEAACLAHDHDASDALKHLSRLHKLHGQHVSKLEEEALAAESADGSEGGAAGGGGGGGEQSSKEGSTEDLETQVEATKTLVRVASHAPAGLAQSSDGKSVPPPPQPQPQPQPHGHQPHGLEGFDHMHAHADGFDFSIENLERLLAEGWDIDAPVLEALRETMYRIVRAEYWEQIEEGLVPRGSLSALLLLHSIDVAIEKPTDHLFDLDVVLGSFGGATSWDSLTGNSWETILGSAWDACLERLDVCLPDWVTLDNEIKYHYDFHTFEAMYYCCSAFVRAHEHAMRTVSEFFGDDPTPDTGEELQVCLESARKVATARRVMDMLVEKDVVRVIKTKLVAEHLLDIEHEYVHRLMKQGVLTAKEAESLFQGISSDVAAVEAARRQEIRLMGRLATRGAGGCGGDATAVGSQPGAGGEGGGSGGGDDDVEGGGARAGGGLAAVGQLVRTTSATATRLAVSASPSVSGGGGGDEARGAVSPLMSRPEMMRKLSTVIHMSPGGDNVLSEDGGEDGGGGDGGGGGVPVSRGRGGPVRVHPEPLQENSPMDDLIITEVQL